jgi:hypothetical protein
MPPKNKKTGKRARPFKPSIIFRRRHLSRPAYRCNNRTSGKPDDFAFARDIADIRQG